MAILSDPRSPGGKPLELFFGQTIFFWLVLIFAGTFLTMRLISEELRSGTIETLMTAPVSETQVVLGKYLAAFVFYLFLWAPTLVYVAIVRAYTPVDWGPVAASYLGIVGIGALFLAVGVFASATSQQSDRGGDRHLRLPAGALLGRADPREPGQRRDGEDGSSATSTSGQHMDDFAKGIVDTRRLVYYASGAGFFLFLTTRALAAKKWR